MQTHYSEIPSFMMDHTTNKNPAMMNTANTVSTPYSPYHYVNSAPVGSSATATTNVSINMINSKKLDPWTLYELAKETQKIKMDRQQQKSAPEQHDKDKLKLKQTSQLEVPAPFSEKNTTAAVPRSNHKSMLLLENQSNNNYFGNSNSIILNVSNCNGKARSKSLLQLPIITTPTNASHESRQEVQKRIELAKSKRKSLLCEVMQQQEQQVAASVANAVTPKKSSKKSKKKPSSSKTSSSKTKTSKKRSSSKKMGDSISSLPALLLGDDDDEDVFGFLEDEEDAGYHHSCNF